MLRVIVLLENKIFSQVVVLLQTESGCPSGFPYILLILLDEDGVFVVMYSVWCPPNIVFSLMAKKLSSGVLQLNLESPTWL